jgi:5-methylcytosine-specific restriction endonuclease McrA
VLQLLNDGQIMAIDRHNMASLENRNVAPQTRYFLTANRYVTRKDKKKSLETKGNGYIISEKGRKALAEDLPLKRREISISKKKEKNCPDCGLIKPIGDFVTIFGFFNPRGKYCRSCFLKHQQQHAVSLMEGRNFCLYCGAKIEKAYDWIAEGKSARTYLHLDHMDPISLGGEVSDSNTVYCCVSCNLKKGNKPFIKWLEELEPRYRELSRKVYIEKHGKKPEEFKSSTNGFVINIGVGQNI